VPNGSLGNIEEGDVLVSVSPPVIDESRFAATDIDDGGRTRRSGALYQFQRRLQMRTVPADRVRSLGAVDFSRWLCEFIANRLSALKDF
jgi:hypothetical protein